MITLHFANPADSPTGAVCIRLRFARRDGVPALYYAHGSRTIRREDWPMPGATIHADSERDRRIVYDTLGVYPCTTD